MKKKTTRMVMVFMMVLFIAGLIIVLSALAIGTNTADKALYAQGGSLPTVYYERIIEHVAWNYRTAGMVISLFGGAGVLLAGFAISRVHPDE